MPVVTTIRDEQLVPGLVPKGESVLQHDVRMRVRLWVSVGGWSLFGSGFGCLNHGRVCI